MPLKSTLRMLRDNVLKYDSGLKVQLVDLGSEGLHLPECTSARHLEPVTVGVVEAADGVEGKICACYLKEDVSNIYLDAATEDAAAFTERSLTYLSFPEPDESLVFTLYDMARRASALSKGKSAEASDIYSPLYQHLHEQLLRRFHSLRDTEKEWPRIKAAFAWDLLAYSSEEVSQIVTEVLNENFSHHADQHDWILDATLSEVGLNEGEYGDLESSIRQVVSDAFTSTEAALFAQIVNKRCVEELLEPSLNYPDDGCLVGIRGPAVSSHGFINGFSRRLLVYYTEPIMAPVMVFRVPALAGVWMDQNGRSDDVNVVALELSDTSSVIETAAQLWAEGHDGAYLHLEEAVKAARAL